MHEKTMHQVLDYIRKESGKTSFLYYRWLSYETNDLAYLTSFSKQAINNFITNWYKRKISNADDKECLLLEITPTQYLLVDRYYDFARDRGDKLDLYDFNSYDSDAMILATNDLAIDQDIGFEINANPYTSTFKKIIEVNPIKVLSFNGLTKKEELSKRAKVFNDGRYRNEKIEERFKNLPVAYRARKTTPERKSGLRQLENSVRRMW